MNSTIKITLICLLTGLFAFASPQVFFTEGDRVADEYELLYKSIAARGGEPTEAERAQLEALFLQINSADKIRAQVLDKVMRYSLFLGLLLPLVFILGRKVEMSRDGVFAVCGVSFAAFIVAGSILIGALVATLFFIANQSKRRPGPIDSGGTPE